MPFNECKKKLLTFDAVGLLEYCCLFPAHFNQLTQKKIIQKGAKTHCMYSGVFMALFSTRIHNESEYSTHKNAFCADVINKAKRIM